jgi:hypothetical protein
MSTVSVAGSGDMGAAATSPTTARGKMGAWGGIAFAVLIAASVFIAPIPPLASDPVEKITNYFADNRAVLLAGQYLGGLGLIALLVFIGPFAALLRALEGDRSALAVGSVGGAFVTAAMAIVGSAVLMALAFTGRDGDAATARICYNLFQSFSTLLWFPIVAWVVLASLILLRAAGAFRWIAYLGLLDGVLGLLTGASVARTGLFALGGLFGLVAFVLFLIWLLALSIVMLRTKE